jgi:hypothetical protein
VFARMSPDDKRLLVELLGFGSVDASGRARTGLGMTFCSVLDGCDCVYCCLVVISMPMAVYAGYYTGFCGDGANDLGALKGRESAVLLHCIAS